MTSVGSSSIDVNSIVSALVANKRAAPDKQISDAQTSATTQLSAIGNFTSALSALRDAMSPLAYGSAFSATRASSSDESAVTASTDKSARPTSYHVEVVSLASAQKTMSAAFKDSTSPLGSGHLSLKTAKGQMDLDVSGAGSSLEAVRDAINKSPKNPGVSASIIYGSDGAHLSLTSRETGAANAFSLTVTGGDGGLKGLGFTPGTDTPVTSAADAEFRIAGLLAHSSSNTVADAVDGATLTLSKVGPADISIIRDTAAVTGTVQSFVSAYNNFVSTYKTLTKYDKAHKQVGALIGDATVTSVKSKLSTLLGAHSENGGGPGSLSDLGISFQVDGTLALDTNKLQTVLSINPAGVEGFVAGEGGILRRVSDAITGWTSNSGILSVRTTNLNHRLDELGDRKDALDTKMVAYEKQLKKRYTALDNLMTRLGSTGSYLEQQFEALNKSK